LIDITQGTGPRAVVPEPTNGIKVKPVEAVDKASDREGRGPDTHPRRAQPKSEPDSGGATSTNDYGDTAEISPQALEQLKLPTQR